MFILPLAVSDIAVAVYPDNMHQICHYELVAAGFAGRPRLPVRFAKPQAACSLDGSENRMQVISRLEALSKLTDDWDAYGAKAIDKACVEHVKNIIDALPATIPSPEIYPKPNGTLILDWNSDGQILSVEVEKPL